jgi:hypothetical protein
VEQLIWTGLDGSGNAIDAADRVWNPNGSHSDQAALSVTALTSSGPVTAAPTDAPVTTAPPVVTATTVSPTGRKNCATLGWKTVGNVCAASNNGWACKTDATYAEAEATCAAAGARVCTIDEIEAGATAQTGCGMDGEFVWSGTWCGLGPKYYCGKGAGTVLFAFDQPCLAFEIDVIGRNPTCWQEAII